MIVRYLDEFYHYYVSFYYVLFSTTDPDLVVTAKLIV